MGNCFNPPREIRTATSGYLRVIPDHEHTQNLINDELELISIYERYQQSDECKNNPEISISLANELSQIKQKLSYLEQKIIIEKQLFALN